MTLKALMAIRTQLDGIQILVDSLIEEAQRHAAAPGFGGSGVAIVCPHKQAVDIGVMGNPWRRWCPDCKSQYDEQPHGESSNEGGTHHG